MEEATRIVRVLIERKHLAGVHVRTETALTWFSEAGLDEERSLVGMVRACLNGWMISRKDGTIELTETAVAAARRSAH